LYVFSLILLINGAAFPAIIAGLFATGMVCDGRGSPEFVAERKRRQEGALQIERNIGSLWIQIEEGIKKYNSEFDAKSSELRQAYQRYSGLDREKQGEMLRLEAEKRQLQLNDFLRAQLISRASISGIGHVRKQRLLSFGIGCALDVRPTLRIPGFGPANLSHLLNWRASCEARFRFDPSRPIPPVELQRLNLKFATLRSDLLTKLKSGPATLSGMSAGAQGRHLQLQGQLEIAVQRRGQAQADLRLCT
jgi:DNA-binding helix-hairpin-helix protein with protein kinase domain